MRMDAKGLAYRSLRRTPAQPLARLVNASRLAVLGYHGIGDAQNFGRHLDHLARTMNPVSLADVERAVDGGAGLPRHAVLLTFDDGERSMLERGLPLMQARDIPGVCFVVPGHLGGDIPFWWNEVEHLHAAGGTTGHGPHPTPRAAVEALKRLTNAERLVVMDRLRASAPEPAPRARHLRADELPELQAGGIEIGNHTFDHPCLDRCTAAEIRQQLARANSAIAAALGRPPTSMAYPNGNCDPRVVQIAHRLGFRTGFLYDRRLVSFPTRHPLMLSRLHVETPTSVHRLALTLSDLFPAFDRARARVLVRATRTARPVRVDGPALVRPVKAPRGAVGGS